MRGYLIVFCLLGFLVSFSNCGGPKKSSNQTAVAGNAGATTTVTVPCTDEATCQELYSGTDCTPPVESPPAEGKSYNYDDIIAAGVTLTQIECLSAYSEIDDRCLDYDDIKQSIDDGDICEIVGAGSGAHTVTCTGADCADSFTAFSFADWGNFGDGVGLCFSATQNEESVIFQAISNNSPACDGYDSLSKTFSLTNATFTLTIDSWENMDETEDAVGIALSDDDGSNLKSLDLVTAHPSLDCLYAFLDGGDQTTSDCLMNAPGEGPVTLRLVKTGSAVNAFYKIGAGDFISFGTPQTLTSATAGAVSVKISASEDMNFNVTLSDFSVTDVTP